MAQNQVLMHRYSASPKTGSSYTLAWWPGKSRAPRCSDPCPAHHGCCGPDSAKPGYLAELQFESHLNSTFYTRFCLLLSLTVICVTFIYIVVRAGRLFILLLCSVVLCEYPIKTYSTMEGHAQFPSAVMKSAATCRSWASICRRGIADRREC